MPAKKLLLLRVATPLICCFALTLCLSAQQPDEQKKAYGGDIDAYLKVNSFETLSELAKEFSQYTFDPMPAPANVLNDLSYDQYRQIEFKYPRGVWWGGKTPFWFESFHRGFLQRGKIELFTLIDGKTKHIPYNSEDFRLPRCVGSIESSGRHGTRRFESRWPVSSHR